MEKSKLHTRRTSAQMFPLVERYKSSGQLQKIFCEHHEINIDTFQYWLKKYHEEHTAEKSHSFQKITLIPDIDSSRHTIRYILITIPSELEIKIPLD